MLVLKQGLHENQILNRFLIQRDASLHLQVVRLTLTRCINRVRSSIVPARSLLCLLRLTCCAANEICCTACSSALVTPWMILFVPLPVYPNLTLINKRLLQESAGNVWCVAAAVGPWTHHCRSTHLLDERYRGSANSWKQTENHVRLKNSLFRQTFTFLWQRFPHSSQWADCSELWVGERNLARGHGFQRTQTVCADWKMCLEPHSPTVRTLPDYMTRQNAPLAAIIRGTGHLGEKSPWWPLTLKKKKKKKTSRRSAVNSRLRCFEWDWGFFPPFVRKCLSKQVCDHGNSWWSRQAAVARRRSRLSSQTQRINANISLLILSKHLSFTSQIKSGIFVMWRVILKKQAIITAVLLCPVSL